MDKTTDFDSIRRAFKGFAWLLGKIGLGSTWAKVVAAVLTGAAIAYFGVAVSSCAYKPVSVGELMFYQEGK